MNSSRFENEYPALSAISKIFRVIGVIIIILAVIILIYGLSLLKEYGDEREIGIYLIVSAIVSALLFSIQYFAFAELIELFVRIEFNTRKDSDSKTNKRFDTNAHERQIIDSDEIEISFEDWKKDNPNKTINDYFASIRKHQTNLSRKNDE